MILGAAEIDLDFNVNVTLGASGLIIGGSSGNSDTAAGAKLALVTTQLAARSHPKAGSGGLPSGITLAGSPVTRNAEIDPPPA
jgi:hypothetical protein